MRLCTRLGMDFIGTPHLEMVRGPEQDWPASRFKMFERG